MKVILLQDVENLGKKDEIKEVADGYARNFLLPNNLVKSATESALEELDKKKKLETNLAEEELKQIEEAISKIEGQEIEILVKIKDNGEIFGSITPFKISQALKKKGFDIKKDHVNLKEQIKKTGEYPVTINFEHGLEAEIKIIIVDEKAEAEKEIKEES